MNDDNLITRKMYKLNTKRATNHPSLVEDKRELWAAALVIPPLVQQHKQCLSDWHPISISTFHQCRDPLFIVFVILVEVRKDVLLFLLWITFIEFRETGGHKNYSQHHHLYLDFFCLLLSNPVCEECSSPIISSTTLVFSGLNEWTELVYYLSTTTIEAVAARGFSCAVAGRLPKSSSHSNSIR